MSFENLKQLPQLLFGHVALATDGTPFCRFGVQSVEVDRTSKTVTFLDTNSGTPVVITVGDQILCGGKECLEPLVVEALRSLVA